MGFEPELPPEIADRAVSLDDAHVAELGFSPTDAVDVLAHIADKGFGVWGGDVWAEMADGRHLPTHLRWSVGLVPDETWEAFVTRSSKESVAAVERLSKLATGGRMLVAVTSCKRGDWELARLRRR